jgi:hypothetical protein
VHPIFDTDESFSFETLLCPTLVCEAEDDQFFLGQPAMLFDALRCPQTLSTFTAAEGPASTATRAR